MIDGGLGWRGWIHLLLDLEVPYGRSVVILRVCWRVLLMMDGITWTMI